MSKVELKMPKMGESISEATILNWLKNVGDTVEEDETILEVATDKVDSEVPAPCSGVITEIRCQANEVVEIGRVIAIIDADAESAIPSQKSEETKTAEKPKSVPETSVRSESRTTSNFELQASGTNDGFLSPLVISIAKKENVTIEELQNIAGTGTEGRIRKSDLIQYVKNRKYPLPSRPQSQAQAQIPKSTYKAPPISFEEGKDRIVEMDRMRTMIADHMVYSKHTSPHVTSYIEVDVTNMVNWRNEAKIAFQEKHGEKLTFTPIFVEAVAKAIQEYPMINVSVDGKKIVVHKDINVGMATALPSGNLIVPVVRNADEKNLFGLAKNVNHLANSARNNALKPDEIGGSTFTISNVGTFGSLMGTPIINQPEVAILALGIIKKRPEVITTDKGDEIAIRSMMYLSLSFDHRVVDGFLGGSFLRKVGDELEAFDINREI
ncbi:dihydrolipoamide acetyltransferase family protein [Aquimarina muelleri]|uniref:Dihydrolipoamide acetyltransferase component of pyruvate dehydrogenase complex n=1 Tax=Aquimarina muelleri TaxID=279356 RepID=A0A918N3Z4_9FLAO|nr:dihydrolipoamide acetyltransferase family protein [Aquimarina muelleri]MCX2762605.1 2-oxo acid dehydrogenase subunit E2 [Aquimarina muelleri]GGX23881.1 dihydrolipoamide acetyltransferase component of pyruvate dehydrogenase complex [Aquimarina muelleri]